jgi:hypothetical protein
MLVAKSFHKMDSMRPYKVVENQLRQSMILKDKMQIESQFKLFYDIVLSL